MTKSSISNKTTDDCTVKKVELNTNDDTLDVLYIKKQKENIQKMTFVRALLRCREHVENFQKTNRNVDYNKLYKITNRLRRILGFPGKTCDLIPKEYMGSHNYIPTCLFEVNTKDERLQEIKRVNMLLRGFHDIGDFEKIDS